MLCIYGIRAGKQGSAPGRRNFSGKIIPYRPGKIWQASGFLPFLRFILPDMSETAHRLVRKAAVLGSGVMGSRIACHLANAGLSVLLLDIVPREYTEADRKAGMDEKSQAFRNRLVNDALKAALTSRPDPLYHPGFARRIETGNFEDDLGRISGCDWIIEAVVENLEIKQALYEKAEAFRKPGTLITSNTSGIPLNWLAKGRSEDFRKHFCGTHFFNPPRYLPLLELIPTRDTDPAVCDFLEDFGQKHLGKTTVICKDTPAFIANRIGVFSIIDIFGIQQKTGLGIEEIDKLTGPVIGHPKSATFRTADVVGLDTLVKVADGLNQALGKTVLEVPEFIRSMVAKNWLGDKTGQGFYQKRVNEKKEKEFWTLDPSTLEYRPPSKVRFATLDAARPVEDMAERWKVLLGGTDKAGTFYRQMLGGLLAYSASCIPEISDEISRVDDALTAGFGWEAGPFETWDMLGLSTGIDLIRESGREVPGWVIDMQAAGHTRFYQKSETGTGEWNPAQAVYRPRLQVRGSLSLDGIRTRKPLFHNAGTTLHDLGEGIFCLEFHTKMNTIGGEVVAGLHRAFDIAEKHGQGLVIGNQGANFSAGANLGFLYMYALEQEYDEIDLMIRQFQQTVMRVRYSAIPVVVAPHGLTLGGGCEMTLHADGVQAAAETYTGLVEVGVGLIPGGGGTKETALRLADAMENGDPELNRLQNRFMNLATGRVSTSATEAFDMGIFRHGDRISMNKMRQIADAREMALQRARAGYTQPVPRTDIRVQGRSGMATICAGIHAMRVAGRISEHDAKVAEKLNRVINGGDLSYPQLVSEQYLLDLEREAFLSLCGERKTLERIQGLLNGGKIVRN